MEARQIDDIAKELQKAQKSGVDSAVLGHLNELKKGVRATEEILRSTRIGVTVNHFKSSKNSEIARASAELVRKWREEVEKEKKGRPHPGRKPSSSQGSSGGATTPTTSSASPATAGKGGAKAEATSSSVPPDKRTWRTDKVDTNRTGSKVRDGCVGLVYDGLVYLSTTPSNTVLSIALAVEEAAYKELQPETSPAYKDKMRMLFQNLKSKSNPGLRARVLHGEITPEKLVVMSHEELKSKELRDQEDKIREKNILEAQAPVEQKSVSDSLQCGRCGRREVKYSQAQTRSADEPMTTFCECANCGKRWKFS